MVGVVCWKPLNICICKFGLRKKKNGCQWLCSDKCFEAQTVVKTIIYIVFYWLGKSFCDSYANSTLKNSQGWNKAGELALTAEGLGMIWLLFGLQHLIFIGARIGVWLFIQLFCLGCVCIEDDDDGIDNTTGDRYAN